MKPITIKTGCQLNSASPPSQAKPSLKWSTHLSTKTIETIPTAAADPRARRSFLESTIASKRTMVSASACNCSHTKRSNPSVDRKVWRTDRGHVAPRERFVTCVVKVARVGTVVEQLIIYECSVVLTNVYRKTKSGQQFKWAWVFTSTIGQRRLWAGLSEGSQLKLQGNES